MEVKNITIVVRGTKGEAMKGIFDAEGNCVSGDPSVASHVKSASAPSAPKKKTKGPAESK
jgi:hypothetical protein